MNPAVGDARFYGRAGPYTAAQVAEAAGGAAGSDPGRMLTGVGSLDGAVATEVSFLDNPRYRPQLEHTHAGAVLVHPDAADQVPVTAVAIVTSKVYESWARVALLFHPAPPVHPGIHPTAVVAADALVDCTAEIGPYACVGARTRIGAGTRIGAHAVLDDGVAVGIDCRIGAHVTVSHAVVGDRVCLYPGVRIGQDGFSFARTDRGYLTIPQLGRVVIEDDVEIGANATVDRGSTQDTVIGAGTRIDNLVQIGHNVRVGRGCVIVAQVGISGSTRLGDYVQVGGQAAMAGHIEVGRGAQIGAQAGVISDVPAGAVMLGSPAQPKAAFFRQVATLKRLAQPIRVQRPG